MNYKLAKELKDAGFPQKYRGHRIINVHEDETGGFGVYVTEDKTKWDLPDGESVFYPTLSDLIDACGDVSVSWERKDGRYFMTTNKEDGHGNKLDFWLPSLDEGFALLWLALNKKV